MNLFTFKNIYVTCLRKDIHICVFLRICFPFLYLIGTQIDIVLHSIFLLSWTCELQSCGPRKRTNNKEESIILETLNGTTENETERHVIFTTFLKLPLCTVSSVQTQVVLYVNLAAFNAPRVYLLNLWREFLQLLFFYSTDRRENSGNKPYPLCLSTNLSGWYRFALHACLITAKYIINAFIF